MRNNFAKMLGELRPNERIRIQTYQDLQHIYDFEKEKNIKVEYHCDDEMKVEASYKWGEIVQMELEL